MQPKPMELTLFKLKFNSVFDVYYVFLTSWVHHQEDSLNKHSCVLRFSCRNYNRRILSCIPNKSLVFRFSAIQTLSGGPDLEQQWK
jgi:hypothetical protein